MCTIYLSSFASIRNRLPCRCVGQHYRCIAIVMGVSFLSPELHAAEYFDPFALQINTPGQSVVDLSIFDRGGQLPGSYRVNIYLNNTFVETRDMSFVQQDNRLVPEVTAGQWANFGVNINAFPVLAALPPDTVITQPAKYIPEAKAEFDFNRQRLDISIPQAALNFRARHSVDPSRWDQGLPAFIVNYSVSASSTWQRGETGDSNNLFLGLNSGLNIGPWRLRNYSTYNRDYQEGRASKHQETDINSAATQSHWQTLNTYVQRDIHVLKSQLTLGEIFTSGEIFDSIPFRGIQIASDDNMLPESQRGFAPVIRGIASSNAQVTIRQNGMTIYQSYVAPGAFIIRDLYATSGSGNLTVTVRESDGSEHAFVQPFTAIPMMQRPGQLRYTLAGGQYRSRSSNADQPNFFLSQGQYGLSNDLTLYGGGLLSKNYQSGVLGIGHGLGQLGSVSLDITQARTTLQDVHSEQGHSFRIQYVKDLFAGGTTFTLAGYRYSTDGFYDFNEANEIGAGGKNGWQRYYSKRSRMQIQINQTLGDYGNLYLSGYEQDYWKLSGRERTLSAGYNLMLSGINYNLNYTHTQTPLSASDRYLAFNMQIPLSRFLSHPALSSSYTSYGMTSTKHRTRTEVGLSGVLLENNALDYSIRESYTRPHTGNEGSINVGYKGNAGHLRGGYYYSQSNSQANIGLDGGVVVHPYGVTLSQSVGSAMTLVRAPGASGAEVQNHIGVTTDRRGYAVVPYASSYHENRVALVSATLGSHVDLESAVKTVVPTSGALVLADFKTRVGYRVLIRLLYNNRPVPFGTTASILDAGDTPITGLVGDEGEVYLSGTGVSGQLLAKWGEQAGQSCIATFTLPLNDAASTSTSTSSPLYLEAQCR